MQQPELIISIDRLNKKGGTAEVYGHGVVGAPNPPEKNHYSLIRGHAALSLLMPRPKREMAVIRAQAEYECVGPISIVEGRDAIRAAGAMAYWLAIENLRVQFIEEVRNTRIGIQEKRINNLVKVWIEPLTKSAIQGEYET